MEFDLCRLPQEMHLDPAVLSTLEELKTILDLPSGEVDLTAASGDGAEVFETESLRSRMTRIPEEQ